MSIIKTYKRKLILTENQEKQLRSWIGACRVVYNLGMEVKIANYKATGKALHKYALSKQLPALRKEISWINDVPAQCLQVCIERLDYAYKMFFRNWSKGAGYPKFASKRTFKSMGFKSVSILGSFLKLPKIGLLKMRQDSGIIGIPTIANIVIEPTGIFACIVCKDVPPKFMSENQAIGLDMGISHFCIDNNGSLISNLRHFKKYEQRLRIECRSLARKKKGSKSWHQQAHKLALIHHTIANVRRDFLHKESTKIAKANSIVFVEDLNIKGLSKNTNLSKHILDCGWGIFIRMLEYKTKVVKVNAKYTSQMCHECGAIDRNSRISQSNFVCTKCGHKAHADVNAAKNILSKGIALNRQREAIACA